MAVLSAGELCDEAVNIESNGVACYGSPLKKLGDSQDEHTWRLNSVRHQLKKGGEWPDVGTTWQDERVGAIMESVTSAVPRDVEAAHTELDAPKEAMARRIEAYAIYRSRGKEATVEAEKKLYDTMADEERIRHLSLLDTYEST
ncbi:MAG TPA: hypothetical protein ENL12_03170 [Dehalococcoidia bacterium]|nr:hypothetical protein [Dehalococcoidia bacterium]